LPYPQQNARTAEDIGYIGAVSWTVFVATRVVALVWLLQADASKVYRSEMARHYFLVYLIVLSIAVLIVLGLSCDGYWFRIWRDSPRDQLVDGIRECLTFA
jgi:hypothetical protein